MMMQMPILEPVSCMRIALYQCTRCSSRFPCNFNSYLTRYCWAFVCLYFHLTVMDKIMSFRRAGA